MKEGRKKVRTEGMKESKGRKGGRWKEVGGVEMAGSGQEGSRERRAWREGWRDEGREKRSR
jgi:hypothetical protein